MKPTIIKHGRLLILLIAAGFTIGLISWGHKQNPGQYQQAVTDTTPKKKNSGADKKVRDLDDVLDQLESTDLEKARIELSESLKDLDLSKIKLEIEKAMKEIDLDKIKKEVEGSMAKIDMDKMKKEMELAMKELDVEKIKSEIEGSLAKVDMAKIKEEIASAMKEVDMEKIRKEVKESIDKVDWGNIKAEMEKAKGEMEKAKVEIEKAKTEIREYKTFVDDLDKDGLISKKGNYTLKHSNGELWINGKKADAAVYNKYQGFLDKHPKFKIDKSDDDFDIDLDK